MTTALLATYNTSAWPIARQDKRITKEVAKDSHLGRFVKNRLSTSSQQWRAICQKRDLGRAVHYAYTLPWQEGVRLVNPVALDEYQEAMANAESAYWQAVDAFIADIEILKAEWFAYLKSKGLEHNYRETDYADLCREAFGFNVSLQPLPHDAQFNQVANIIGAEKAQELADELIDRQSQQWESATRDVWERLHKTLQRASDKLNHGQRLHDSVMDNLQDLTDLLPVLNITNDPDLEQSRRELVALFDRFSSTSVRDKENRKSCASEVDAILAKLPGI